MMRGVKKQRELQHQHLRSSSSNLFVRGMAFTTSSSSPRTQDPGHGPGSSSVYTPEAVRRQGSSSSILRRSDSMGSLNVVNVNRSSIARRPPMGHSGNCNCREQQQHVQHQHQNVQQQHQHVQHQQQHVQQQHQHQHVQHQLTHNLQQQIYMLEMENNYLKRGAKVTRQPVEQGHHQQQQLVHNNQLHKSISFNEQPEYSSPSPYSPVIDHRQNDNYKEFSERAQLEQQKEQLSQQVFKLQSTLDRCEERNVKDRRALLEENVDLQKRLDELTPELAKKESQIARTLAEKEALVGKLRFATGQIAAITAKLEDKRRAEDVQLEMSSERTVELERLTRALKKTETELNSSRGKEKTLVDEVTMIKRRMREEELHGKKERSIHEKLQEENNTLIKENSQLSAEVGRLQLSLQHRLHEQSAAIEIAAAAEITQARENEKTIRDELMRTQERLRTEQETVRQLEREVKDRKERDDDERDRLLRIEQELEGLQALSRSLTNENRSLRQEKIEMNERLEEYNKKLVEKEQEMRKIREQTDGIDKHYRLLKKQLEEETAREHQKTDEFDKLVHRVHELCDSLPARINSAPSTSSIHRRSRIRELSDIAPEPSLSRIPGQLLYANQKQ